MGVDVIYNVSLVAAFAAGMVALFAPCCISYLLPAYFGNVFKEKKRVLLMTLIYSAGIFVVMLPIVLGAKALAELFFQLHDKTYIVGGGIMVALGVLAFLGIKLPMPRFKHRGLRAGPANTAGKQTDVIATFTLGVISGITSACCAPVLLGVLTLSSLSPSLVLSLGVGVAYVLGMVTPLYLASLLIERGNILERPWLKKQLTTVRLGEKAYPVYSSNIVAAVVFVGTGLLMLSLTFAGKLGMQSDESEVVALIQTVAEKVTALTQSIPLINVIFGLALIGGLYWFIRRAVSGKNDMSREDKKRG
jgi:cytochrome c-type biogenesis protein